MPATPRRSDLRPMSTPFGEKNLVTVPVPLEHLTAHLGYEGLEGG